MSLLLVDVHEPIFQCEFRGFASLKHYINFASRIRFVHLVSALPTTKSLHSGFSLVNESVLSQGKLALIAGYTGNRQ